MNNSPRTSLRLDEKAVEAILRRLERESAASSTMSARRSQRYEFHGRVVVELVQSEESIVEAVYCRNLSRDGMSFLVGRFVYENTPCRVRLVSEYNHSHVVEGHVARCRYIPGTPSVHEIGVQFSAPIDVALFSRNASSVRVLVVDNDDFQKNLLRDILGKNGAEALFAESAAQAVDLALSNPFDLVVVSFDSPELNGCSIVRALREKGYVRPISSFSSLLDAQIREKCAADKCESCQPIELSRPKLVDLVNSIKSEPVLSTMANDREAATLINQFVFSIQDRITELEKAFLTKDLIKSVALLRRLTMFSQGCGFDTIADSATELGKLMTTQEAFDQNRDRLNRLVRLCLAARPASQSDPALQPV